MGGVVASLLLVTPVSAQTAEAQYRASLLSLIALLQEQIAVLQLQLDLQQTIPGGTDELRSDVDADIVASYTVAAGEISQQAPRAYRAYFERLLEIFPNQYDDHIDELVIFTNGDENVGAYVETTIPYTKDWRYAVRESEVKENPRSTASTELMIHEFAHIFSLDQVFRDFDRQATCHPYFADGVCYSPDTYIGEFIATFWTNRMLDDLVRVQEGGRFTAEDFYEKYESEFVTDYAATDPAEDFAESFTSYVYGEIAPRGSIADQKIEFFDRFSYIRELAADIQGEM